MVETRDRACYGREQSAEKEPEPDAHPEGGATVLLAEVLALDQCPAEPEIAEDPQEPDEYRRHGQQPISLRREKTNKKHGYQGLQPLLRHVGATTPADSRYGALSEREVATV